MNILFNIYLVFNSFAGLFYILMLYGYNPEPSQTLLIYPWLNQGLNEINLAGKIIVNVLFTLIFLPALVVYFGFWLALIVGGFICWGIGKAFCWTFKKRK